MKRLSIALAAIVISFSQVNAQADSTARKATTNSNGSEIQTLLGKDKRDGFYFGMDGKATQVGDQNALIMGGRLAWVVNRSLGIGIAGYGLASEVRTDISGPESHGVEFGYGGIYLEPIVMSNKAIHLSAPVLLGAGGVGYFLNYRSDYEDYEFVEADAFFVLEPTINLELNLTKAMRLNIGGGYRYVADMALESVDEKFLNGPTANLGLKIGLF